MEEILRKTIEMLKQSKQRRQIDALYENLSEEKHEDSAVDIVKRYIAEHISEDLQRDDLAKLVFMNPDYLSRLFKKQEGIGLAEYIIQKKLDFVKKHPASCGRYCRKDGVFLFFLFYKDF